MIKPLKKLAIATAAVATVIGCTTVSETKDDSTVSFAASTKLAASPLLGASSTTAGTMQHKYISPKNYVVTNAFQNAEEQLRSTFSEIGDTFHSQSNIVKTTPCEGFPSNLTYKVENNKVNYLSKEAFDKMYDDMDDNWEQGSNVVVFLQPKPVRTGETIRYELLIEEPTTKVPLAIRTTNDFSYVSNDSTIFSVTNFPVLYHFRQMTPKMIYVTRDYLEACERGHLLYSKMGLSIPDEW